MMSRLVKPLPIDVAMVVDTSRSHRRALKSKMEWVAFDCRDDRTSAREAAEFLGINDGEYVNWTPPPIAALVTDLKMPEFEMTGYELLLKIKLAKSKEIRNILVYVMTEGEEEGWEELRTICLEAGASGVFKKPVTEENVAQIRLEVSRVN